VEPYKLARVAKSTGKTALALLGKRAKDGQIRAHVYDVLSNTRLTTIIYEQYGTTVDFRMIPDSNGNGVAELVRLREQPGPQTLFAEVHDGETGQLIAGMHFGSP
jgi:hypothetical protein